MAPRTRSSHMARSGPGRTGQDQVLVERDAARPGDRAVASPRVPARSSMPAEADVMTASVRSGLISETAPTTRSCPRRPPATTTSRRWWSGRTAARLLDRHPFEQCHVRPASRRRRADRWRPVPPPPSRRRGSWPRREEWSAGPKPRPPTLPAEVADPLMLGSLASSHAAARRRTSASTASSVPRPGAAARHRVRAPVGLSDAPRSARAAPAAAARAGMPRRRAAGRTAKGRGPAARRCCWFGGGVAVSALRPRSRALGRHDPVARRRTARASPLSPPPLPASIIAEPRPATLRPGTPTPSVCLLRRLP
ncbi:hypothetical protein SGRIM128S_07415 [Streptomyces griseomycini]